MRVQWSGRFSGRQQPQQLSLQIVFLVVVGAAAAVNSVESRVAAGTAGRAIFLPHRCRHCRATVSLSPYWTISPHLSPYSAGRSNC